MDPEPVEVSSPVSESDEPPIGSSKPDAFLFELESSLGLSSPSISVFGAIIAMATLGVPLAVVLTDRTLGTAESTLPTALELNGSKPSLSFSIPRIGESNSGDSSR